MIMHVYSVFDKKAGAYFPPFFAKTHGMAERNFMATVMDEGHDFHIFAEDYGLFRLGTFDDTTGKFDSLDSPEHVVDAHVVKAHIAERMQDNAA